MQRIIEFVENVINENNKCCNAVVCGGDFQNEIIIKFKKKDGKEKERYKKTIEKALEYGAIIKKTCPATLETTLKF